MSAYQRNWEQREKLYTARYSRQFERLLNRIWRRSARIYEKLGTFEIKEDEFIPLYRRLYVEVGRQEAKLAFDMMPQEKDIFDAMARFFDGGTGPNAVTFVRNLMQQYFNVYVMERLRNVTETTRVQINRAIQEGTNQGLGGRGIAKLIREKAPEINKVRSIRIARTESVTAANKSQLLAHEASPYEYEKAWLPVVDNRTRPSHEAMDSRFFIPLWDYFYVANSDGVLEEMMTPGDTNASADNTINCRCVLLFRAVRDENGRLVRKRNIT
jgi:hypothetical protein